MTDFDRMLDFAIPPAPAHSAMCRGLLVKFAARKDVPFTVAVDLDGTLAEKEEPFDAESIGPPVAAVVNWVRRFHRAGARIVIFTVRGQVDLVEDWLDAHDVPFDFINENPDQPADGSGKVIADLYLDDKALNVADLDEHGPYVLDEIAGDAEGGESEPAGAVVIRRTTAMIVPLEMLASILEPGDD